MGPPLTALSDDIQAAVFAVAGGRLLSLAVDSPNFKPFKPLVLQLVGSEGLFERSLAMAQTLVDAADPATWAPYVINQRVRPASRIPHVLFTVALNDDTVPPVAGRALARALGTPHVGTVHEDVGLIPLEDNMPVVGNRAEGLATAGFFQFDRISQNDTAIEATHGNVPFSPEGSEQTLHFFETWVSDLSEIVDPYVILNTPQIP